MARFGARLIDRLAPALDEVGAALDVVNGFRERPPGQSALSEWHPGGDEVIAATVA